MEQQRTSSPVTLVLLLGVILFLVWREAPWAGSPHLHDPNAAPREVTARGELAPMELSTIELFERAKGSVVHITTTERVRYQTLWGVRSQEVEAGTGSGFVWDERGTIVTNFHVVAGATTVFVRLSNGKLVRGAFVGADPDHDLAVLRIEPDRAHPPLPIGTSADLRVGQSVFAIGNPFGLDWTLTTGVVSGLDRSILSVTEVPIDGVIQTDAAINPGNSGGPLLDSAGRLIGVNTAIYSPSGASAGIGFAVPVDTVNELVPTLIRHGRPPRPGLGVMLLPDRNARAAGIQGLVVTRVLPGGAGERAGLRSLVEGPEGVEQVDVIVEVDGTPVRGRADLENALRGRRVGDEVEVVVLRNGRNREVLTVVLQDVG